MKNAKPPADAKTEEAIQNLEVMAAFTEYMARFQIIAEYRLQNKKIPAKIMDAAKKARIAYAEKCLATKKIVGGKIKNPIVRKIRQPDIIRLNNILGKPMPKPPKKRAPAKKPARQDLLRHFGIRF